MMRRMNLARDRGFTLVELLVVIAIIGILAGMVVPNVTRWIRKARVTAAIADIRNVETSLTGMLADGGRQNFRDFFTPEGRAAIDGILDDIYEPPGATVPADALAAIDLLQKIYNQMFYELLRSGRFASEDQIRTLYDTAVDPDFALTATFFDSNVIDKLGPSYMDLGTDPWGRQYNFWIPPSRNRIMIHRSYRAAEPPQNDGDTYMPYYYNQAAADNANAIVPGQPPQDNDGAGSKFFEGQFGAFTYPAPIPAPLAPGAFAFGHPASRSRSILVSSRGPNQLEDANLLVQLNRYGGDVDDLDLIGGGDDINNWDTESGWEFAPQE